MNLELDEQYVQARRVLLDALEALGDQRRSVIVAGAQAIYLQAGPGTFPSRISPQTEIWHSIRSC